MLAKRSAKALFPYTWVLPAIVLFLVFTAYPLAFSVYLGFHEWSGYNAVSAAKWIGLDNYHRLLRDGVFWIALRNTALYTVGTIVLQNALGFGVALVLNYGRVRGAKVWKPLIFFPATLSVVVVALLWSQILAPEGMLNHLLQSAHLFSFERVWLADPRFAIWVTVFVTAWQWTGYNMVIYDAGLQTLPGELLEAAKIDGATSVQAIWRVVVPLMRNFASMAIVLNIIGGFRVFDIVWVLTRGGPAHASEVLTTYMYFNAFSGLGANRMGYGSALAVVLTVIVFALSLIRLKTSSEV